MGVKQTFAGFRPSTQKLIRWSLFIGVTLTSLLIISDARHDSWWEYKSYIPNVLAAFTGFLVGAPLALVVLATFAKEQEDKATVDRVNRLSQIAWNTYRDQTLAFCSEQRINTLSEEGQKAAETYLIMSEKCADYPSLVDMLLEDAEKAEHGEQLLAELQEHCGALNTSINEITKCVGTHSVIDNEWAGVVSAWRTLDQYVKLQRLEQGLEWIELGIDSELQKWMSSFSNPLRVFLDLHEIRHVGPERFPSSATMRDALNTLEEILKMTETERRTILHEARTPFTKDFVDAYITNRNEALMFTSQLAESVRKVEKQEWPKSASKPVDKQEDAQIQAALDYHEKLRRRPKGHRSGSDLRKH